MILLKNWNFPLCLFLDKMGLEIMFDGHPRRKQATLDYKISIYKVATLDFLKEVNPRFWSKIGNVFFVCDTQGLKIVFDDYLVQKQPMVRLDYKIRKASNHDFGKKSFLLFFFWGGTKWALKLCLMII